MKKYIFTLALAAALSAATVGASAETIEANYDNEVVPISLTAETESVVATVESISTDAETDVDVMENTTAVEVAPETEDKGSPDTGVAGVAAIAGAAVVAGGVIVLTRKRK